MMAERGRPLARDIAQRDEGRSQQLVGDDGVPRAVEAEVKLVDEEYGHCRTEQQDGQHGDKGRILGVARAAESTG